MVAESFLLSVETVVSEVKVKARKIGSPTDTVVVTIQTDSSGKPSGTILGQATLAGSNLPANMDWVTAELSSAITLSADTYWLVIDRTGANDGVNYYATSVDTDAGYADGVGLRYYSTQNPPWVGNDPSGDFEFEIVSVRETTEQIQYAITNAAQFLQGVKIEAASGVYASQYRNGDYTALKEIETLLESGGAGGRRLLATVTPERYLLVYEEPARPSQPGYTWGRDGHLWHAGEDVPVSSQCPVAQWAKFEGVPPAPGALLAGTDTFFIEHAAYDTTAQSYTPEPREVKGGYDL